MANIYSKDISIKIKGLGIYQVVGGILGVIFLIWLILGQQAISIVSLFLLFAGIGLFLYSVYCGSLLLKQNIEGLRHSLINQYLQLINFSVIGYAFQYVSGIFFSIGIGIYFPPDVNTFYPIADPSKTLIMFKFNFGVSEWAINISSGRNMILLNLNLVALFLINFINKLKRKISMEAVDIEISQVATEE